MAKRNQKINDKTGLRYGKLLVIKKLTNEEAIKNNLPIRKNNQKITYYLCRCDCENNTIVQTINLQHRNRGIRSCGCSFNDLKSKYPALTTARILFDSAPVLYSDGDLSFSDFVLLTQQNCTYCGWPPTNVSNIRSRKEKDNPLTSNNYHQYDFIYNGLDRIDSNRPHDRDNVVPCCKICNRAKGVLTIQEFEDWIKRIHNNLQIKNITEHTILINNKTQELLNQIDDFEKNVYKKYHVPKHSNIKKIVKLIK